MLSCNQEERRVFLVQRSLTKADVKFCGTSERGAYSKMSDALEFIVDRILPIVGKTVTGFTALVFLVVIIFIVYVLVRIKDYKQIKSNTAELFGDIRGKLSGRSNRKNRVVLLLILVFSIILSLGISAVLFDMQKGKQLIITSPTEKISQDIWNEMLLTWQPITGTGKYFIKISPIDKSFSHWTESNSFYVDGDESGVKFTLGKLVFGTGKYKISVSSDVEGVQAGSVIIYLIDQQNDTTYSQENDLPSPTVSIMPQG